MSDHDKLLEKPSDCTKEILEVKKNYILKITAKLQDPKTAVKMYWAVLIRLRLLVNGKFISDFCEKVNLFNNFFASICTPIKNSSVLPVFSYRSIARTSFHFTAADIPLMIKTSGSDKAHGCDKISKKMIRV